MNAQPTWGVFENDKRVDVAPVGHRHVVGEGSCWCGVRIETGDEGGPKYPKPLVVHSLKTHDWFVSTSRLTGKPLLKGGVPTCRRCGVVQNSGNADSFCKGPVRVGPR